MVKRESYAVIGLGQFGSSICDALVQAGQEVLAIDSNEEVINCLLYTSPEKLFDYACQHNGFKNRESTILFQRCQLFSQVNLPLYKTDEHDLRALVEQLQSGNRPRLTKEQIQQLLASIADDWRQVEQQITLDVYKRQEFCYGNRPIKSTGTSDGNDYR